MTCTECGKTVRVVNSPEEGEYCTCLDQPTSKPKGNTMKRTIAVATLALALLAGGATQAEASTPKTYDPNGVTRCVKALKWAHRKGTEAREDKAVRICGRSVTTEAQADRLYRWASKPGNRWALDLIG